MCSIRTWTFCLVLLVFSAGCQFSENNEPNVLLVAIEGLSFSEINCGEFKDMEGSAFATLCNETVRFTHAYTPSLMTQATMASMLTGRYPHQVGVGTDSNQKLSAKVETVAEIAHRMGYRTAMFSGGPPMWRKSGLAQGFLRFWDSVQVRYNLIFNPVSNIRREVNHWLKKARGKPWMAVTYLPDLQFPKYQTRDANDLPRERSKRAQLLEIDTQLNRIFSQLKEDRQWHKTFVVVTGMNGTVVDDRRENLRPINLFSEGSQVPLFIKPSGKRRDLDLRWKVDVNVSLADVGRSLYALLGHDLEISGLAASVNLLPLLETAKSGGVDPLRPLFIESGWASLHGVGDSQTAVRIGPYLFFNDKLGRTFNSLIDRNEINSLQPSDEEVNEVYKQVSAYLQEKGLSNWTPLEEKIVNKYRFGSILFDHKVLTAQDRMDFRSLTRGRKPDVEVLDWMAHQAIVAEDWSLLKSAGNKAKNFNWLWLADAHLGQRQKINAKINPCLSMLGNLKLERLSLCPDRTARELLVWLDQKQKYAVRERAREKFYKLFYFQKVSEEVYRQNYVNQMTWVSGGSTRMRPSISDLILAYPGNQEKKRLIYSRLLGRTSEGT